MGTLLSADEVATSLRDLPGWSGGTSGISRTYAAPDFPSAIALVVAVARQAEAANHHPDIDIRWRNVTFTLVSHDAGGLTERDTALAGKIAALAAEHRAE